PEADHPDGVVLLDAVANRREHACCLRPLLDLAIEPGVLDRRSRTARKLLGEQEIALLVAPSRLGSDEGDRADDTVAGWERHAHVRLQAELAQEVEMELVGCRCDEVLV